MERILRFDPQALTSLTCSHYIRQWKNCRFRSTGSYEPDPGSLSMTQKLFFGFDPQALTSLTPQNWKRRRKREEFRSTGSYEPDPFASAFISSTTSFRSTGSYEPDRLLPCGALLPDGSFDPQALTSLTSSWRRRTDCNTCFDP